MSANGSSANGPLVREVIALLERWQVRLLAGEEGLDRTVSWASVMRARLPAFEGFEGGELALLSLATLRALRSQLTELSLPLIVEQLAEIGVSAIAIAGLSPGQSLPAAEERALDEAQTRADALSLPLLALPPQTPLKDVEREVILLVADRRERAPEPAAPADYAAHLRASLRGEALDALLTGTYASETAMRTRAAQLGYELTQPHVALWVDLAPLTASAAIPRREAVQLTALRLAEELGTALGAWARARESQVVALLPLARADRPSSTADVIERVAALLTRALGDGTASNDAAWSAGIGEVAQAPAQVRHSATQARDAARLGLIVLGPRRIARPTDLGVYRLLLALRDSGDLAPFVERTLAPLLADTRNGSDYIQTIEAFFACNGNLSEAARTLHLHRNSVLYRLNRARELLGHDLDDAEVRLALQLAIKGQRVLSL